MKKIQSLHHDYQWNFLLSVISQWSIGRRKYFSLSALFTLPHQNKAKEKVNEYFFASKVFVFLLHIANHRLSLIKPRAPPNHELSSYNTNVDRPLRRLGRRETLGTRLID